MQQNAPDSEPEFMDLRGLKCPLPALMTRRALESKPAGAMLTVTADDPMAFIDVPHMCRSEGHDVISTEREGDVTIIVLRRGNPIS
jgi:tRNA 2-thiouridine synthesizing protein A